MKDLNVVNASRHLESAFADASSKPSLGCNLCSRRSSLGERPEVAGTSAVFSPSERAPLVDIPSHGTEGGISTSEPRSVAQLPGASKLGGVEDGRPSLGA